MTVSHDGVVIVGAGLGGIRVAENLRANGYEDSITLIGAEVHPPYDRPPLSKSVLRGEHDRVDLKPAEFFTDADITFRSGQRVTAIDTESRTVTVEFVDSPERTETIGYAHLVLATGLTPRTLSGTPADVGGLHVLRTVDDALALRAELVTATTAVVIGAGFVGCEVAASLVATGLAVVLVEPAATPLAAALGGEIGALITRLHQENGVEVITGVGVDAVDVTDGRVSAVDLGNGTRVPADIVVVGIGSTPVVDYLEGSGIVLAQRETGGGIACDEHGATSAPDVYAVGDVANWSTGPGARRVEHWTHTVEQAAAVAHRIAGSDATIPTAPPYFWSDQFDLKIQVLGSPRPTDTVHMAADDGHKFLAYYSRDGLLTAVVGAGKTGAVMKRRAQLLTPTPIEDVLG